MIAETNTNWQVDADFGNTQDCFRNPFDCPFCGVELETTNHGYACANPLCPYAQSADVRAVVASLQECDYSIEQIVEITENISIDGDENASLFIDSRSKVEWALKKLAGYDDFIAQGEAIAQAEIDAIRARSDKNLQVTHNVREAFAAFANPQIEKFARADMAVLKRKSIDYLYGTIKVTAIQPKFTVLDSEGFCSALLAMKRADLVRTTHAPQLDAIKKAFKEIPIPAELKKFVELLPAGENIKITASLPEVQ